MDTKKVRYDFIVPAAVVAVFAVLAFLGVTGHIEDRVYDMFLHVKPAIPENPSIRILGIDDQAINNVGQWPWSRDIMANALILMREFGAAYAVFDIEYLNKSPRGVDDAALQQTIPEAFDQEFAQIDANNQQLFDAIRSGSIRSADIPEYLSQLAAATDDSKTKLLASVEGVARDNDVYLGQAARFFGSAFLTVDTLLPLEQGGSADLQQYAMDHLALKNVTVQNDPTQKATSLSPAILPIIQGARGAGFPNVVVDPDGVRRRINLIMSYQGTYYASLAFRPLLDWLGDPPIVLKRSAIVLKGAKIPGQPPHDVTIPLGDKGRFLINWPPKKFLDSFQPQLPFYDLVYLHDKEMDLMSNLRTLNQDGVLALYPGAMSLLQQYKDAEKIKNDVLAGGDRSQIEQYVQMRAEFFDAVGTLLNGDAEKTILGQFDAALADKKLSAGDRQKLQDVRAQAVAALDGSRSIYQRLMETRQVLAKSLPGAFCIIGVIATSTTDIGVNPFAGEYPNVGTHASVVNTILQQQFLTQSPDWVGIIVALLFSVGVTFAALRLDPRRSIIVGLAFCVGLVGLLVAFFLLTGIYVNTVSAVASVLFTFVALTIVKFLRTERERSFVRSAFAHYLSSDVINDLLANPDKLHLGGEEKTLTAIFTDVKGFSTLSEALSPSDLVRLLNQYLTTMSDIVMEMRGTIDKYEGDAIISFFGAPVEFADHAKRACAAAVRMKRAEIELNARFMSDRMSPNPLFTRIGINTGPMVVGNMGTLQKMDYTIMGSSVNLASRLEGVNKQYNTWILMSEATHDGCGDEFFVRKLDRVRVVGINQPVRLYELLEERSHVEKKVAEGVGLFHQALEKFESKDWPGAEKIFDEVLRVNPDDGPSKIYTKRCQEYRTKPPVEGWDGVFNLTMK